MEKIIIRELSKAYYVGDTEVFALNNINLKIFENEFTLITGESGSGKTTFLNMLGTMDYPTTGEIVVDNKVITDFSPKEEAFYRTHKIGYIHQAFNLIEMLTIEENILLPIKIAKIEFDADYYNQLLNTLGIQHLCNRYPGEISGGQKQRVAIARALINKPDIILADEPTGNLDKKNGDEVLELLINLCRNYNKILIMVSHNVTYHKFADRIISFCDGTIIEDRRINDTTFSIENNS